MYLPVTVYLIGYIFGPLVFGPLSEAIGRRPVVLWTFNVFIVFTLACALAPNWPSFLIFRCICGTCASVPLTVIGGLYADIFESPKTRGRAMVCFMSVSDAHYVLFRYMMAKRYCRAPRLVLLQAT